MALVDYNDIVGNGGTLSITVQSSNAGDRWVALYYANGNESVMHLRLQIS